MSDHGAIMDAIRRWWRLGVQALKRVAHRWDATRQERADLWDCLPAAMFQAARKLSPDADPPLITTAVSRFLVMASGVWKPALRRRVDGGVRRGWLVSLPVAMTDVCEGIALAPSCGAAEVEDEVEDVYRELLSVIDVVTPTSRERAALWSVLSGGRGAKDQIAHLRRKCRRDRAVIEDQMRKRGVLR